MSRHQVIATNAAPKTIGPYVQAVVNNGILYASGCLPLCPQSMMIQGTEITEQTVRIGPPLVQADIAHQTQVLKNVTAVLKSVNADQSNVLKTTVFLQSMNDFATFNKVYADYFGEDKPARSCVEVAKLPLNALVEIEFIARVPA